jgi:ubiquinone/menaquinone biosynthesis C-methylase UbiE
LTIDNPEELENFRKRFPKVKLVIGDGRNIPFPDSHFDIAFSNAVVEHVGGGKSNLSMKL